MQLRGRASPFVLLGLSLLPLALAVQGLAFSHAHLIERVYGRGLYPRVALVLGTLNRWVPYCLGELLGLAAFVGLVLWTFWHHRAAHGRRRKSGAYRLLAAAARLWIVAGILAVAFLVSWGLNYARPSLRERLGMTAEAAGDADVLGAALVAARRTASLHAGLGTGMDRPTRLSMGLERLDATIDRRFRDLALPGDLIHFRTSPVKRLLLSRAISYLGITGVFIPFTGEPTINGEVPDVVMPFAVAHEKAHQRGITHEGEANFAAFLACAGAESPIYLRYSAYLFAATRLIGAASTRSPEKARSLWNALGPGPRRDIDAVRTFWSRYEGPASDVAHKINDTYLRSQHVERGIESYGEVVELLVALYRDGSL